MARDNGVTDCNGELVVAVVAGVVAVVEVVVACASCLVVAFTDSFLNNAYLSCILLACMRASSIAVRDSIGGVCVCGCGVCGE